MKARKNNIINMINSVNWWLGEGPGVFHLIFAAARGFSTTSKHFPEIKSTGDIFIFIENGYIHQFMSEDDSINSIRLLIERDRKDKRYIRRKLDKWRYFNNRTKVFFKRFDTLDLSALSDRELYRLYRDYSKAVADAWAVPLILEGSGIYYDQVLVPKAMKAGSEKSDNIMDALAVLATPDKPSFTQEAHLNLLNIAVVFKDMKVPKNIGVAGLRNNYHKVYKKLFDHQKRYYWIRNNYSATVEITIFKFLDELEEILENNTKTQIINKIRRDGSFVALKRSKDKIKKRLDLPKYLIREAELFAIFTHWQDERKKMNLRTSHYIAQLIKEISRRLEISGAEGYYLYPDEIKQFLLQGLGVNSKILEKRKKILLLRIKNRAKIEILENDKCFKYKKELLKKIKIGLQTKTLKGSVVYRGKVDRIKGRINLVLDVKKARFKKGDILVTSMTRPEFLPILKKAKAVITNEGGITSHAAIVSRELGIPCIVGTKIATNVLRDGDEVEIDIKKGVVKVLLIK